MVQIVYVNGEFVSEEKAKISIFDRGFLFSDSVYEVTTVLERKLVAWDGHIERLKRSLTRLNIIAPFDDKLLLELQNECFPLLQYNQILINKNNTFKPHKDSNNIKGNIFIFSIGDYIGDLHIEGIEYNTCLCPIIFNGKKLEHSVPNIIGTRYSILFYTI